MALDPWSYAGKTRNEYAEQVALFMWANMAAMFGPILAKDPHSYTTPGFAKTQFDNRGKLGYVKSSDPIPELRRLFAIKNAGHGDAVRGAMSKAEGVKAGVPDIMLPVIVSEKVSGYMPWTTEPFVETKFAAGLFIELKRQKSARGSAGGTSDVQDEWIAYLRHAGYAVEVCVGWEAARDAILRYLGKAT
jgi:hypothetical protein